MGEHGEKGKNTAEKMIRVVTISSILQHPKLLLKWDLFCILKPEYGTFQKRKDTLLVQVQGWINKGWINARNSSHVHFIIPFSCESNLFHVWECARHDINFLIRGTKHICERLRANNYVASMKSAFLRCYNKLSNMSAHEWDAMSEQPAGSRINCYQTQTLLYLVFNYIIFFFSMSTKTTRAGLYSCNFRCKRIW